MNVCETQVGSPGPVKMTAPRSLLEPLLLYSRAWVPTEKAAPVCCAQMVTLTRDVPILV